MAAGSGAQAKPGSLAIDVAFTSVSMQQTALPLQAAPSAHVSPPKQGKQPLQGPAWPPASDLQENAWTNAVWHPGAREGQQQCTPGGCSTLPHGGVGSPVDSSGLSALC